MHPSQSFKQNELLIRSVALKHNIARLTSDNSFICVSVNPGDFHSRTTLPKIHSCELTLAATGTPVSSDLHRVDSKRRYPTDTRYVRGPTVQNVGIVNKLTFSLCQMFPIAVIYRVQQFWVYSVAFTLTQR